MSAEEKGQEQPYVSQQQQLATLLDNADRNAFSRTMVQLTIAKRADELREILKNDGTFKGFSIRPQRGGGTSLLTLPGETNVKNYCGFVGCEVPEPKGAEQAV